MIILNIPFFESLFFHWLVLELGQWRTRLRINPRLRVGSFKTKLRPYQEQAFQKYACQDQVFQDQVFQDQVFQDQVCQDHVKS